MIKVTPISDDELLVSLEGMEVSPVPATTIIMVWDESAKGESIEIRYREFTRKLSEHIGKPISLGTAYLVLEAAVGVITSLKKTHIG